MDPLLGAFIFAVMAGLGAIVTGGKMPDNPVEWCGLALAVLTAGWGKYTNSEDFVKAPRVLTDGQRRALYGIEPLGRGTWGERQVEQAAAHEVVAKEIAKEVAKDCK